MIELRIPACDRNIHLLASPHHTMCLCGVFRKVMTGAIAWKVEQLTPGGWVTIPSDTVRLTGSPSSPPLHLEYTLVGVSTKEEVVKQYQGHPEPMVIARTTDGSLINQIFFAAASGGAWKDLHINQR